MNSKPYYETENGKLYHGDCIDILPHLKKTDIVITDPPYGLTQNGWDNLEVTIKSFDIMYNDNIVFTCQNPSTSILIVRYINKFKWCDVWHKSQAVGFLNARVMPLRQHEDIVVLSNSKIKYRPNVTKKHPKDIRPHGNTARSSSYGKYNTERKRTIPIDETYPRSVRYYENSQNGFHPTEKPISLIMDFVLNFSDINDIVKDPFGGSGTTAIACERLKRKWILIEKEEKYCEIAAKRIEQERQQLKFEFRGV